MNRNTTWVVVASNAMAKIYRLVQFPKIEEINFLEHAESKLRNQDIHSSPPGRSFDSLGGGRHAYNETDFKQLEIDKFARQICKFLSSARQNEEFFRLYLFANPPFLGLLRQHLDPQTKQTLVAESQKDLINNPKEDIEKHLAELI